MRIVVPPLVVEENESFKNDLFERRSFGESLLNVVERSKGELVISLDGQWGEGKTTFVKMWQGLLNESNIPNIYVDAFTNDYVDDAFISIASAITSYVDSNSTDEEKAKEFKERAKDVGGKLLAWTAKLGVKAATLGVVKDSDIEELQDIKGDLSKSASAIVGEFIDERLSSHSQDIELVQQFKELLSELPAVLSQEENKPFVVIIDELDRCKPTYAVDLIEKIKHLFAVSNVVFLLVMHKKQLEEAVKCIYGQNIDAHAYLQKFINIETTIPKRISARHGNDLSRYSQKLLELHELETWGDDRNIVDCIEPLAMHFNLSLRQLEKIFTNIAILYSSSSERHLRLVPIIVFISVIKVVNTSLFQSLLHQNVTYESLCNEVGLSDDMDPTNSKYNNKLHWLMMWVKYSLISDQELNALGDGDRLKDFGQSLFQYNVERERLIPIFIQQLSMFSVE